MTVQLEDRVLSDHPLRKVRVLVTGSCGNPPLPLSELYLTTGRPSIPPERLLRALLLQYLYGVRNEPAADGEQPWTTDLLFCWLWGWGSTTGCGMRRRSRRIGIGC